MRTILSQKIPKRSVTSLFSVLLLTGAAGLNSACDDEKDYSRKEHIEWSNNPEMEGDINTIHVPVRGGKSTDLPISGSRVCLYIKSNVDYKAFFEADDEEEDVPSDWIRIVEIQRNYQPGIDQMVLEIDPHPGTFEERKGCISLLTDVEFLNDFIPIIQGFPARVEDANFDWLKYGSTDPLETKGEMPINNWATTQKDEGWESIPAEEDGPIYCYGKNGYIRLGDDAGHGANLLTPYAPKIKEDTAVMVRFNAIAYAALDGTQDNNKLTVKVTGGGQFFDGTTTKELTLNYLDPTAEDLPTAMWKDSQQEFIIVSHPKNLFTSNTRIELMAGEYNMPSGNTRIFIDNFYLFQLRWYNYSDLFGKLPWEKDDEKPKQ